MLFYYLLDKADERKNQRFNYISVEMNKEIV